jgi:hypothetical protein
MADEPTQTVVQADPHRDPPVVDDHPYEPRDLMQPWGRCRHCRLAEAAHAATMQPYQTTSRRAT